MGLPMSSIPICRGRPRLSDVERKSRNLTFRVRDGLREKLAEAAQRSGRSVSEEIEYRLQLSFLGK